MKEIFYSDGWFTGDVLIANEWESHGRIFGIPFHGERYYAKYQFDASCTPLPVIEAVLEAYGDSSDPWAITAWFHFANGWIADEGPESAVPVSPKDALGRVAEIINAARNRRGTYIA